MGDDRRTDATEQRHGHAEGDPDTGEHEHQPDVPAAAHRVDVGNPEQQALQDDHGHEG